MKIKAGIRNDYSINCVHSQSNGKCGLRPSLFSNLFHSQKVRLFIFFFVVFSVPSQGQFYYGIYQEFGKNRVQYNDFAWQVYRLDPFDVYYYAQDRNLPKKVAIIAERNLSELQRRFDANMDSRLQIILFTSLSDLKQSNLIPSDETDYNTGGVTRLVGSKLFVYFDGDYRNLEQQLRKRLAELILADMIYGDIAQSIRNSTLLNLPDWYYDGLISYMSTPWNLEIDQKVREGVTSKKYKKLNRLTDLDAEYAGHSLWHFIGETFGESVIRNVIYMSILNRNIETGFEYILGVDLKELTKNWWNYYESVYRHSIQSERLEGDQFVKMRKNRRAGRMLTSADGKTLAMVHYRTGEFFVYTYNTSGKKKRKRILKGGYKITQNPDYSYPLLAWHPNNRILAIITEEKGFIWLYFYDTEKKKLEKRKFFGADKVLHFEYSPDGREFVMSAVKNGKSDIYRYTILSNSYTNITNDDYNDLWPTYANGGRDIVFSSDRPNEELEDIPEIVHFNRPLNLFMYTVGTNGQRELRQMTNTNDRNEIQAKEWETGYIHYLATDKGVRNEFVISIDSSIAYVDTTTHYAYHFDSHPVSDLSRNVLYADINASEGLGYYSVLQKKRFRVMKADRPNPSLYVQTDTEEVPKKTSEADPSAADDDDILYEQSEELSREDFEININDYSFDPRVLRELEMRPLPSQKEQKPSKKKSDRPLVLSTRPIEEPGEEEFKLPPRRNYFLSFYQDELTFQVDNTFQNPVYQPYTGRPNGNLMNPGFNGLMRFGITDILNDYRVVAGLRTNFQPFPGMSISPNHEIFFGFINQKKRLNHETYFFRRSQLDFVNDLVIPRYLSHELKHQVTYPFSPVAAMQFSGAYRLDHVVFPSREPITLQEPTVYQHFGILKAAYIYDNTVYKGVNLYNGTRYKIFTEYYRRLDQSPSGLHTLGIDYRNYTPVHGSIIWANRFAAGTSFGHEKLIHFMGGVDNQFVPNFDQSTPIAEQENYIFQTLVTNMRGFFQNVRNGNSFATINSELRVPFFRYIMARPIRNEFLQNFQIIGFGDLGTAWNGPTPYSEENAINTQVIDFNNMRIEIDSQKEPIIGAVGFGLRSKLFGYFVRADWGWGIEDGIVLPRIFHISIGTDF